MGLCFTVCSDGCGNSCSHGGVCSTRCGYCTHACSYNSSAGKPFPY